MATLSCPLHRPPQVGTVLSLSLLLSALTAQAQPVPRAAPPPDPLVRMNESIDALTRKVWPSVVQILVSSYGPRRAKVRQAARASSSGGSGRPVPDS